MADAEKDTVTEREERKHTRARLREAASQDTFAARLRAEREERERLDRAG